MDARMLSFTGLHANAAMSEEEDFSKGNPFPTTFPGVTFSFQPVEGMIFAEADSFRINYH